MGTPSEGQPDNRPEQSACDACRYFGWRIHFPGEFQGKYRTPFGSERQGNLCILHYQDKEKAAGAVDAAILAKTAQKDFDFSGAWFPRDVRFTGELKDADFRGATFSGAADFVGATFSGDANFRGATFSGAAYFREATFSGEADFVWATFKESASFIGLAKSRKPAENLWEVGEATDRKVPINFSDVALEKPAACRFEDVDMQEVSLLDTDDVRKISFQKITWPDELRDAREAEEHPYSKAEREAKEREYSKIGDLYRDLRKNYEQKGNYAEAGLFHYGEMEMRRKALPRPMEYFFSLTALYWLSSGYGQRVRQAGLMSAFLFVLFAWLYMVAGLQEALHPGPILHSASAASLHTAEVITFVRERTYVTPTNFGKWVGIGQIVLMPLQIALFLLAVRRSFKR